MAEPQTQYAGRGGEKLSFALDAFGIDVNGLVCADLGCNVGGFTDCLLSRGATKVYAIDTGYGMLAWKLRNDERVVVMERTNALRAQTPELVDLAVVDVGWTRQILIIPAAMRMLKSGGRAVSLVKPQYEAREAERAAGVVKPEFIPEILDRVRKDLASVGVEMGHAVESPIKGGGGNVEFFICVRKK
jgi:23S rRNA (cytidine1920-2'-O)/16S rRNA (cytidine1409-2'-O)-methyltransferase